METLTRFSAPLGRTALASIFLVSGFTKLADPAATIGYMQAMGVASLLFWPAAAFEILAPIALIAGFQARIVAFLLAGFSVLTAILFHFNFADQIQSIMFLKNIAIAGGLLLVVAHGPGALSLGADK